MLKTAPQPTRYFYQSPPLDISFTSTYQKADDHRRGLYECAMFLQRVVLLHLAADQVGAIGREENHDEERHHQRPVDAFERRVKVDRVM